MDLDNIVRTYISKQEFEDDAAQLAKLGYVVTSSDETFSEPGLGEHLLHKEPRIEMVVGYSRTMDRNKPPSVA